MARSGGYAKTALEQTKRDDFICKHVALGLSTKYIKEKALELYNTEVKSARVAEIRHGKNATDKWQKRIRDFKKKFIRYGMDDPVFFPIGKVMWAICLAEKCEWNDDMKNAREFMKLAHDIQQTMPGNQILNDYSLSGLVEKLGEQEGRVSEELTIERVTIKLNNVQKQIKTDVSRLLEETA
jgi:hypothetical protein